MSRRQASAPSLFDRLPAGSAPPLQVRAPQPAPAPVELEAQTLAAATDLLAPDDVSPLASALHAWRAAGAARGQCQYVHQLLEIVPSAPEWTAELDRAHLALDAVMAALSDIQGASGIAAQSELLGDEVPA